jgi:hypothetical protein
LKEKANKQVNAEHIVNSVFICTDFVHRK